MSVIFAHNFRLASTPCHIAIGVALAIAHCGNRGGPLPSFLWPKRAASSEPSRARCAHSHTPAVNKHENLVHLGTEILDRAGNLHLAQQRPCPRPDRDVGGREVKAFSKGAVGGVTGNWGSAAEEKDF